MALLSDERVKHLEETSRISGLVHGETRAVFDHIRQLAHDLEAARADLAEAKADLLELRETISPGRMADAEYYLNVAKKMRARELEIRPK